MKIRDIRRRNLLLLKDSHGEGKLSVLGDLVDRNPSVLSQVKNDTRGMGERLARHFEQRLGLPKHWMDQLHDEASNERQPFKVADESPNYKLPERQIPETSRTVLEKLTQLARNGTLSESDFELIDRLVSRFANQ